MKIEVKAKTLEEAVEETIRILNSKNVPKDRGWLLEIAKSTRGSTVLEIHLVPGLKFDKDFARRNLLIRSGIGFKEAFGTPSKVVSWVVSLVRESKSPSNLEVSFSWKGKDLRAKLVQRV